jgi:hypothetical protein
MELKHLTPDEISLQCCGNNLFRLVTPNSVISFGAFIG